MLYHGTCACETQHPQAATLPMYKLWFFLPSHSGLTEKPRQRKKRRENRKSVSVFRERETATVGSCSNRRWIFHPNHLTFIMKDHRHFFFFVFVVLLLAFFLSCAESEPHWLPATATWYGSPDGDGSDGGACGYGSLVDVRPFRARVGAVSPVLFKDGEGCGACYKVRCLDKSICSRRAVTVIVVDECPGGYCANGRTHFDLSGAAFGRMAISGEGSQLRNRGEISVNYRRTPCKYRGKNIAFRVNEGSTDYWLSLLVEFEDGDGDIGSMHIKPASSNVWIEMKHLWGANWCIIGGPLQGPFSVKLTTLSTQRTLSARDVIPRNWSPLATYTSRLNFF